MFTGVRLAVFVALTAFLAYVSRASLLRPRTHGFFRFFGWEAILALVLLNIEVWFQDALAWHQVASWILLMTSLVPLVLGVHALRTYGESGVAGRSEPELFRFERTTRLVREGIFRHVRHPLYTSLLLLAWGVFFKAPSWIGAALAAAASVCLFRAGAVEEAECLRVFGPAYCEYTRHTSRFIPHVY